MMRAGVRIRVAVACLFPIFFALGQRAVAQGYPETGTSWNLVLRKSLPGDWYLSSINNFATKTGIDDYNISYLDLTLGRNFGEGWAFDAGYRHTWIDLFGATRDERRPLANLKFRFARKGWFVLNRFRVEYRDFRNDRFDDRVRLRHQFFAVSPWKLPGTSLRWFFEEEPFWESHVDDFTLNWLTTGFRFPVAQGVNAKVGYRLQNQKIRGDWETRHVAVFGLIGRF